MYTAEFEKGRVERKAGFQSRQTLAESQAQPRLPLGRFQKTLIPSSKILRFHCPRDTFTRPTMLCWQRLNG
jgi:hypothetical protein